MDWKRCVVRTELELNDSRARVGLWCRAEGPHGWLESFGDDMESREPYEWMCTLCIIISSIIV